ncbi:hypothetical protein ACLOJK_019261 [Asimina triloba]
MAVGFCPDRIRSCPVAGGVRRWILTVDGADGSPILIIAIAWWTDGHGCSARISGWMLEKTLDRGTDPCCDLLETIGWRSRGDWPALDAASELRWGLDLGSNLLSGRGRCVMGDERLLSRCC